MHVTKALQRLLISKSSDADFFEGAFSASKIYWRDCTRIYIGNLCDARNLAALATNDIGSVLNLSGIETSGGEGGLLSSPELHRLQIDIDDHPSADILGVMPSCYDFIERSLAREGNVLIHCASGISRSVTVCAMFLMIRYGCGDEKALEVIRECRPMANPNVGFRHQLRLLSTYANDITKAREMFIAQNSDGCGILGSILALRNRANDLHKAVDEYELLIKSQAAISESDRVCWTAGLTDLMANLNTTAYSESDHTKGTNTLPRVITSAASGTKEDAMKPNALNIRDKVSDMIIKSAESKCTRLLADLRIIS